MKLKEKEVGAQSSRLYRAWLEDMGKYFDKLQVGVPSQVEMEGYLKQKEPPLAYSSVQRRLGQAKDFLARYSSFAVSYKVPLGSQHRTEEDKTPLSAAQAKRLRKQVWKVV